MAKLGPVTLFYGDPLKERLARLALGMPPGALSGAHIRYHAHRAGVPIHDTLAQTVDAALRLAEAEG